MKENKPTNETGNNPEAEQEKEVLPSFFPDSEDLYQQASLQQKGAGVQHHAFGTGENQYRRLQVDDEGGQENGRGHQAPAAMHHSQRAAQGKLQETDRLQEGNLLADARL